VSKDISKWFPTAKPGEIHVYHTGFLAMDNPVIGRDARQLAAKGQVCLIQRRLTKYRFEYLAVKMATPNPDLTWPQWPISAHDFHKPELEVIQ